MTGSATTWSFAKCWFISWAMDRYYSGPTSRHASIYGLQTPYWLCQRSVWSGRAFTTFWFIQTAKQLWVCGDGKVEKYFVDVSAYKVSLTL